MKNKKQCKTKTNASFTYPIGCPRETAPPLMFTFCGSMPSILMLASTTTLKASLISHIAMSSFFRPVSLRI